MYPAQNGQHKTPSGRCKNVFSKISQFVFERRSSSARALESSLANARGRVH